MGLRSTKEPYRDGSHKSHCSCSYLLNAVYDERDKVRAAVILNDALCAEKDAELDALTRERDELRAEAEFLKGQNSSLHDQLNEIRRVAWEGPGTAQIMNKLRYMLDRPKA